jgi:benzoylformate decarboxylase
MARPGKQAIYEQFLADGITCMIGNPGTVEQGFLDELAATEGFRYVLALQEAAATGIADGYARATGRPALLQLHTGVGLGNAIGMLYQAKRGHAPIVAVAGHAGLRYEAMDAQMAADLVAMAGPVTKWATRVLHPEQTLRTLRRAIKIAMTPPRGPVFVELPMDVLDALTSEPAVPTSLPVTACVPAPGLVERAAQLLAGARRPLILIGDGVTASGAQAELTHVAERLGADVWGVDYAEVGMDSRHPLFRGLTGHMFGPVSTELTKRADAVLVVGTYLFPEVFPDLETPFAEGTPVVHVDLDAYEIAKNHPVTLGLVADPKWTLAALGSALDARMSAAAKDGAARRLADARRRRAAETPPVPVTLLEEFMAALADRVPDDVMIFDEALTASPAISTYLPARLPGHWFLTRGGSLGVGIPGAIGVKLAHPGKTVIGFTGDGGSMYTIQALATAVRHGIGAKFVICNNHRYGLLDDNIAHYWRERGIAAHDFPRPFDLSRPELGFTEIARGHGVDAVRVEKPGQIGAALDRMLADDRPFLIDLVTA